MSSPRSQLFGGFLLFLACLYTAHCSLSNSTENEITVTLSGEGHHIGLENVIEVPDDDYSEDENPEEDLSGYSVEDIIRVQAVVKPADGDVPASTVGKKKADKKKKGEKKKNKQKTPCQTTHKNFCVHGKCRYLTKVPAVSCKCHENYFGERCTELFLRTGTTDHNDMTTTTILAVIAVLLSVISITAIIIIIVVHTRRKYSSYDCEAEETKKLGQDHGSDDV